MPNYKELYLEMVRASERAIRELIRVQQACEDAILSDEKDSEEDESQT